MASVKFKEKQRFRQVWLWLIMLITGVFPYYAVFGGFLTNPPIILCNALNTLLVFVFVLHLFITVLLLIISLEVEISGRFLIYQFFPFHLKKKKYSLNQIHSAFIREFNPVSELSGIGIKFGNKTKPYNIRGKWGLHIEFINGKQLLLGTQKPEELSNVLRELHINEG